MSAHRELLNLIADAFEVVDICERKLAAIKPRLMAVCNGEALSEHFGIVDSKAFLQELQTRYDAKRGAE